MKLNGVIEIYHVTSDSGSVGKYLPLALSLLANHADAIKLVVEQIILNK